MFNNECILKEILAELKKLNKNISIRTNSVAIINIDTSSSTHKYYKPHSVFGTGSNIICTQLTIVDIGGGFYINVNNTGFLEAIKGYTIDNEEIKDIEIYGTTVAGTGILRLGATL